MDDLRQRIEEERSDLQLSMADLLPGFQGYLDRETRRDADKMLRDHLAAQLEPLKSLLNQAQTLLTERVQLALLDDIERLRRRVDTLIDRLRSAPRGYAGFLDAVKVNEDKLDAVYEQDATLLQRIEPLRRAVEEVLETVRSDGGVNEALTAVRSQLDEWDLALRRREEILRGLA